MLITELRTRTILHGIETKYDAEWCSHYGEPGYSDSERGIVFANWNNIDNLLSDYLEEAGFNIEWSDEWYVDCETSKAWRTSPDCYSWVCQLGYGDGYVLTPDNDIDEWLELVAITDHNQPCGALPSFITLSDLTEHGYVKYNGTFENGFHPGQTDDPAVIVRRLFDTVDDVESVVFRIAGTGQFDVNFEAYYKLGE